MTTPKTDYLESDQVIPEQRFVCLSLVLPESLVQKREMFYMTEFFKRVCEKYELPKEKLAEITEDFEQFKQMNSQEMDKLFAAANKNRTSINGLKIRGVYETQDEASARADRLRESDPDFSVFIADVGRWLPISPSIEYHIKNEKFLDSQLNDLIGGYKQNLRMKDEFYEKQKRDQMKQAQFPGEASGSNTAPNIQLQSFDTVGDSLSADHLANRAAFNEQAVQASSPPIASAATGSSSSPAATAGTSPAPGS